MRACNMPGKADVGGPSFFCGDFGADDGVRRDLPMTVYSLTGFIGGLPSTVNPIDAGQVAANGNGELQLLVFDEVAVGNGFCRRRKRYRL